MSIEMSKKLKLSILVLILFLASFLRLYRLGTLPSGINADEVAIAYDAYSILKTGKDQWGKPFPLDFFKSFGDYKLPTHFYLTIPSIAVFGLNEFSARLPSAILGILTVCLTYFLTQELFKKSAISKVATRDSFGMQLSAISSFLIAINPWHIVFSRTGHEVTTSVFLVVLGMWLFLKGNFLFFLAFFLGFYAYHTSRAFILLLLPILFFLYRKEIKKNLKIYWLFYFLIILTPFLIGFLSHSGRARLVQNTGVIRVGMMNEVNTNRGLCLYFLPAPLCRLLYNRLEFFSVSYLKNYFNYFSPFILFTHGIQYTDTYSLPRRGLLYLFELPFVLLGAFVFFKNKYPHRKLLAVWLLLYPVPGSLISFDNSRRMTLVIPLFQILGALGMVSTWAFLKKKLTLRFLEIGVLTLFLFLIVFSFSRFLLDSLIHNIVWSKDFKYGFKEMVDFIKLSEDKYDQIFINNYYDQAYIYYLFFTQYDPLRFQDESNIEREMLKEDFIGKWLQVYRIDKVHFFSAFNWKEVPPNSLFVMEPGRETDLINIKTKPTRRIVKEINDLKGEPVFTIIEVER